MLIGVMSLISSVSSAQDDLRVLPDKIGDVTPSDMMKEYLLRQIDAAWQKWKADYELRTNPEDIVARSKMLRDTFVEKIGGFPERTPLNPQVVGVIERPGYRVEKILFESQPKLFVSALLFLPASDAFKPPYPGVVIPCGHAQKAKGHEEYQSMGASLALNGFVALVFDPIEQGERMQSIDAEGRFEVWGTTTHTQIGAGSILLGRNTARFEIWDGMRAIDYIQSRPEVDPERIGVTGNSGGGTQTSYLMSLDDRLKAAVPSCFLNRVGRQLTVATGDAEQNIYEQCVFGMDHADYMTMRAPMPLLICAATKDFFEIAATWESFRFAKRLYSRLGYAERIDLLENDAEHNYNRDQRTGVLRWMARWLQNRGEPLIEPEIQLLSEEEYRVTPKGQVLLLEGARSTYDLNADYEDELAKQRRQRWESGNMPDLLKEVRAIVRVRHLDQIPEPEVETAGTIARDGYTIEKVILKPEAGLYLPGLLFVPVTATGAPVLYINEEGKSADLPAIEALVKTGRAVLAIDLRGTGETRQTAQAAFGPAVGLDWEDYFRAYVLGKSYVGMRAEDVLIGARYLMKRTSSSSVDLAAVGNVGVPALHAAALEPHLFGRVSLKHALVSWSNVINTRDINNQLINSVHGALKIYDLPDLAATLGAKLVIEEPFGADGEPAK